jgi:outer membrane protein assembly factor BamD (BamD/ComL family)
MILDRWKHLLALGCLGVSLTAGCSTWSPSMAWDSMTRPSAELPPPPKETVYRAGHWDAKDATTAGTLTGDLASTKLLYEQGNYSDAEKWFRWLGVKAERDKNNEVYEECLFHEAESLFAQNYYPKARDLYAKLVKTFPTTRYRKDAIARQNYIAEYWLEDTRKEMQEWEEVREGKRWFVTPRFMNFDREKPTFDQEGNALKACEAVFTQDPSGPLAPQALFRAGGIHFYRENYQDADLDYSLLVDQYPRSSLAPAAMELAIQAKIQQVRGADYDGRKLTEARQLVDKAVRSYPELNNKKEFLERTLYAINEQQAQKDFGIAEFYRRTRHAGAAHFYYELVRLRYPGTHWEQKAIERLSEIRHDAAGEVQN